MKPPSFQYSIGDADYAYYFLRAADATFNTPLEMCGVAAATAALLLSCFQYSIGDATRLISRGLDLCGRKTFNTPLEMLQSRIV